MSEEFKEKLLLYKSGKLTEAEAAEIKREIDKYLAISDYLDDESRMELPTDPSTVKPPQIKTLKRKLNIRYMLISLLIIMALGFGSVAVYYSSGNLISGFYPDLSKTAAGRSSIESELNIYISTLLPETYRLIALNHDKNLFARYTATLVYSHSLMNTKYSKMELNFDYLLGKPTAKKNYRSEDGNLYSAVAWGSDFYLSPPSGSFPYVYKDKKGFEVLEKLPKGVQAEVWISFNRKVPVSEIKELLNITTDSKYSIVFSAIDTGYNPNQQADTAHGGEFNQKIIFGLRMQNLIHIASMDGTDATDVELSQDWINANYLSLLTHMQNRQDDIKVLFENSTGLTGFDLDLKNRIEFIKNNGVNCIGVVLVGNAEDILNLRYSPFIYGSNVKNVAVW